MTDELIPYVNDTVAANTANAAPPWKLLVVDDDPEVHRVTDFVLYERRILGRPLRLLHAHSGQQAREQLREHADVAVVLLDVVMETEHAGLDLVGYIRDELALAECRIILRTGQPGYAPELAIISEYDINDYRTKAELTHTRLITMVSAALRAYEQLHALTEHRRGLELIVRAAAQLMEQGAIAGLAEGVLVQLAALLRLPPDGIVCTQKGSPFADESERCYVVGAAGRHAGYIAQPLDTLPDRRIVTAIHCCVERRQHIFGQDHTTLYLRVTAHQEAAIFLASGTPLAAIDQRLVEVFIATICACFRNARLLDRLRTAQEEIERQRSFLRAVIDADPQFVFVQDHAGKIVLANESLARHVGVAPEQMVGRTLAQWIGLAEPVLVEVLREDDRAILNGTRRTIERELHCVDRSTQLRWYHCLKAPIRNPAGAIEQVIGIAIDITQRKRADDALFEAKERAQVTLHSIGDAVITTDTLTIVDYLNPAAEVMTGWPLDEARGRRLGDIFHLVNEHTREPIPAPVERCLKEGRVMGMASHAVLVSRGGKEYHIDDSVAPIRGSDGQMQGVVLVFHDVTEHRRLTRQLEYEASHDSLTGLINRQEFERRLARALHSAQQYGAYHALCYLDLDQFKIVNDTAGHPAGDELLRHIHAILSGVFRERDTLARIGGDEFGLLLENCPPDRAVLIAQNVVSKMRDYRFHWEGRAYQIGVSIGLVPIAPDTPNTTLLLTQADVACYIAKETGRNRVHVYEKDDSETTLRHGEIVGAASLRDSLEKGRFRLHYQPIVALQAPERPLRYEVLLRMDHASGGGRQGDHLMLPATFIPAAERYGLMAAIDRWVMEAAFREYATGVGRTGAHLSLNLSGNSLSDDTLLQFIEGLFANYPVPAERVCFEITETAAIHKLHRANALMGTLKRHGSQFALDDFGSGLSSFHYLKTLSVDYLKIDGSFVKDMIENDSDCALVAAINQMGHTLGIQTVAEYAHSLAIVERLREIGVDYAQGYYIGRPMPRAALA